MKFCCGSNAAMKNVKIARKKKTYSQKYFKINLTISKVQIFRKKHLFLDFGSSSCHFDYSVTCL